MKLVAERKIGNFIEYKADRRVISPRSFWYLDFVEED